MMLLISCEYTNTKILSEKSTSQTHQKLLDKKNTAKNHK